MIEHITGNQLSSLSKTYQIQHDQILNGDQQSETENFSEVLKESITKLNSDFVKTDGIIKDYLVGNKEINDVVMAMEKLNLEFKLAVQIRNKLVDAYQEIMRMQV